MSISKLSRTPLYLAMFASTALFAEEIYEYKNTIVVTASGYSQDISEAPASISVIDEQMLEEGGYADLTDVLTSIPGVTLTKGGYAQDLSIRGMDAVHTAILVDGKKRSARATQVVGTQSLEHHWLPPLESIERIEIIRGPMSTLYGSDAMAGVINIITKKGESVWHGSFRTEAIVHENSEEGNFVKGQAFLSGPIVQDLLTVDFSYLSQKREEDEYRYGFREHELSSYRAGLHLTPTDADSLSLEFDGQNRTRTSSADKTATSSRNFGSTENESNAIALSHTGKYDWIETVSYIQRYSSENVGRDAILDTWTLNTRSTLPVFSQLVTVGTSADFENIEEPDDAGTSTVELDNYQWALFAEYERVINQDYTVASGIRFDKNGEFDANLSGRLYGLWEFADGWTLKSGVATGFRAPTLQQMTSEWYQTKDNYVLHGNDDLEPEISFNKEIGIHYSEPGFMDVTATAFHNDFRDKIDTADCPESICGATDDQYYANIDDAVTYGVEVSTAIDVTDSVTLDGAYTYTYSEQLSGDYKGQPLTQIPLHFVSLNAGWKISERLDSWLKLTYRGEESDSATADDEDIVAPAVTFVDFGGSWQMNENVAFLAGVYNLFNKETSYDEYGYIEEGRRLWLAADLSF